MAQGEMRPQESTLSAALQILRRSGVQISSGGLDHLSVILPDRTTRTLLLHVESAPPPPSRIAQRLGRDPEARHLFVMDRTSASVDQAMRRGTVDGVVIEPPTVIIGGQVLLSEESARKRPQHRRRGKTPWGRWALDRVLILADTPLPQTAIAQATGISQQAVSQALNDHPLVRRVDQGWEVDDREKLVGRWISAYPGPGGATTYWYALRPVLQQGRDALEFANELAAEPLLSGDSAADEYVPWRLPRLAVLYLRDVADFTPVGFSPAAVEDATLAATVPADPTIWPVARAFGHKSGELVDPLIAMWDLRNGPGPDAAEAARQLQSAIEDGRWRG